MSLRYQDTDLRTLRAAYKPLISKELGRRIDSEPETYYGDNGASREVLARTNDVVRLTKALASGAGVKFAANTTLAAGLGRNSGDPKKFRSIGLAAANRAASLLANAATAGTGYHTGDPLFPYTYLGTSNFSKAVSFFGDIDASAVIGNDPNEREDGLNAGKRLREYYLKSELLLKTPPGPPEPGETQGVKPAGIFPVEDAKDAEGVPVRQVDTGEVAEVIKAQRLKSGLTDEEVGAIKKAVEPSGKKFNSGSIGDRTDDQIEKLKSYTETREDRISKVYTVTSAPSYDYSTKIDELNALDITNVDLGDNSYDFINFKMVIKAPGEADDSYLFFRSYLMDYNDNYDGQWSGVNYIGRAEPLYNYTGFNRQIGFNFMVAAGSKNELRPLYDKLNRLVSTTAPSYSSTFMRGVYVQLTIGDLLVDTPGFFNNLSLSWNTSYPWEIGYDPNATTLNGSPKVPTVLDVSANFTPVHNFTPEYKQPFLLANV